MSGHFLIVEARFYAPLADLQAESAIAVLQETGCSYERVSVPGALEIPAAIAMAHAGDRHFDGYIALGCVIRGETSHYDTVCNESARGLMDLALAENMAKHTLTLKDASMHEIIAFLDAADQHGGGIQTVIAQAVTIEGADHKKPDESTNNVSYEARQLKKLYLKLGE